MKKPNQEDGRIQSVGHQPPTYMSNDYERIPSGKWVVIRRGVIRSFPRERARVVEKLVHNPDTQTGVHMGGKGL